VQRSLADWQPQQLGADTRQVVQLRPLELSGQSNYMRALREHVDRLAGTDASVMLIGPPGSMKQGIAQHVHLRANKDAPFVVLNGEVLDERTAVAELFGSEYRGQRQPGLLEQANGGTLYLQDFIELPVTAQKLLHSALVSGEFQPLGSTQKQPLSLRLIASSSDDPHQALSSGRLLEEFFYLVNVVPIQTLPLNEHREDVPVLIESMVTTFSDQEGLNYRVFSIAIQNKLRNHDWRGNERELRNLIKRLLILGESAEVSSDELEEALVVPVGSESADNEDVMRLPLHLPLREARAEFEKVYLARQLHAVDGRIGDLAPRVGMERTHLYRKLRSLGIDTRRA